MHDEHERHDREVAEFRTLSELKTQRPELFARDPVPLQPKILTFLGMTALPPGLPLGYIRLFPEDFIVEEMTRDGATHTIEPDDGSGPPSSDDRRTLYCDAVKKGIGTADMQWRIAEALGIDRSRIQYAGLKDEIAITSQMISLRGVRYEEASAIQIPGVFLKSFRYGKDIIRLGSHASNTFTILIRTDRGIDDAALDRAVASLAEKGFLNYYGHQRFGYRPHRLGGRHGNHVVGKYVCRGEYDRALKAFLTGTNDAEMPLFAEIRQSAEKAWGSWEKLRALYAAYPVYFERELILAEHMLHGHDNALGALRVLEPQVKMWVHAYVSYCFNLLLSDGARSGVLPETLPLPISPDAGHRKPYEKLFVEHGTTDLLKNIRPFESIAVAPHDVPTRIVPEIHRIAPLEHGVIIHFTLGKACYATTMLLNLFTLITDEPVPAWVNRDKIDVKATIGTGSVQHAREKLGKDMGPME